MKYGKHFQNQMKDPAFLKALGQEQLIMHIQEEICRLMEEGEITRNELAKRMGKSKGFITQILDSDRNLTLRTVADVFTALGAEITVKAKRKRVKTIPNIVSIFKFKQKWSLEDSARYSYESRGVTHEPEEKVSACV